MKDIHFYKYHGAGNDFIIIDNRVQSVHFTSDEIAHMCHRRFGIGADGLMLIESDPHFDFKMIYYNSDGQESTMCGNGGRCIILAASDLGLIQHKAHFNAIDGAHDGLILADGRIQLSMIPVDTIDEYNGYKVLNTGSPHIIIPVDDVLDVDVYKLGKKMRQDERFSPNGINVNFIDHKDGTIHIRTYERGVEDETWACGTGVTAAALSSVTRIPGQHSIEVHAKGGTLLVDFTIDEQLHFKDILLTGPAQFVFKGTISI